jgi:hypothetical protein
MRNFTCPAMTASIERILCAHNLLTDFMTSEDFAVRISNPPYMPLTIERHGKGVSVTHYYSQNGDLVPDPDMEFEIVTDHIWSPVAIQFATGHYRRAMELRDGKCFVNAREMREQIQFSRMWARNLTEQGFANGVAKRID